MNLLLDTTFVSVSWEFILSVIGIIILAWIINIIDKHRRK